MFFPHKIVSIAATDRVLEVGPGGAAHPQANILLEKRFATEQETCAQRGYATKGNHQQETVYYDGGKFPFHDNQFDYVICSHVLEHIPADELDQFLRELQRVASKGYIEFPNIFYELINYQDVHLWLMNCRDDHILFLDKQQFTSNAIHLAFREMFYARDGYMNRAFEKYVEFFFCGFEWHDNIQYSVVGSCEELFNSEDLKKVTDYFEGVPQQSSPADKTIGSIEQFLRRIYRFIKRKFSVLQSQPSRYSVASSALIEKKELVVIKNNAEIKDYVIIRTYDNPVVIGEYVQINPFTVIYGGSGVIIGNNVMIAPHCMIAAGDHDFRQTEVPIRFAGNLTKGPIVIEDNVWIGANCTITDGVRIGRDAVVAANSVVTKDVAPFDIVGGVPARRIANRKELA